MRSASSTLPQEYRRVSAHPGNCWFGTTKSATPRRCSIDALVQPRRRSALMPKVFGEGFNLPVTYCPADKCANLRTYPHNATSGAAVRRRRRPRYCGCNRPANLNIYQRGRMLPCSVPQNKVKLLCKSNDGRPAPGAYLRRCKIGVARLLKVFMHGGCISERLAGVDAAASKRRRIRCPPCVVAYPRLIHQPNPPEPAVFLVYLYV